MDNIIQIIVFFFIVYSILAPILGKKKPPQKTNKKPVKQNYNYNEGVRNKPRTSSQPSSTDILEDILGFKIPKTGGEYEKSIPESRDINYDLKTVDYDTDLKTNYRNLETDSKIPNIDYDKLPSIESDKKFDSVQSELIADTLTKMSKKTRYIKSKIVNKAEIRDIFLIKEIIDKPKALRR